MTDFEVAGAGCSYHSASPTGVLLHRRVMRGVVRPCGVSDGSRLLGAKLGVSTHQPPRTGGSVSSSPPVLAVSERQTRVGEYRQPHGVPLHNQTGGFPILFSVSSSGTSATVVPGSQPCSVRKVCAGTVQHSSGRPQQGLHGPALRMDSVSQSGSSRVCFPTVSGPVQGPQNGKARSGLSHPHSSNVDSAVLVSGASLCRTPLP